MGSVEWAWSCRYSLTATFSEHTTPAFHYKQLLVKHENSHLRSRNTFTKLTSIVEIKIYQPGNTAQEPELLQDSERQIEMPNKAPSGHTQTAHLERWGLSQAQSRSSALHCSAQKGVSGKVQSAGSPGQVCLLFSAGQT